MLWMGTIGIKSIVMNLSSCRVGSVAQKLVYKRRSELLTAPNKASGDLECEEINLNIK